MSPSANQWPSKDVSTISSSRVETNPSTLTWNRERPHEDTWISPPWALGFVASESARSDQMNQPPVTTDLTFSAESTPPFTLHNYSLHSSQADAAASEQQLLSDMMPDISNVVSEFLDPPDSSTASERRAAIRPMNRVAPVPLPYSQPNVFSTIILHNMPPGVSHTY
jgi:hypothetical protein